MSRLLVVHGEGIGNIIEVLPLIATLEKAEHEVDILLPKTSFPIPEGVFVGRKVYDSSTFNLDIAKLYSGKIVTTWGNMYGKKVNGLGSIKALNNIASQRIRVDQSEVKVYLNAARDMKIPEVNFVYDVSNLIGYNQDIKEEFDVVVSNGYNYQNKKARWDVKGYARWNELIPKLNKIGLSVCSIGAKKEFVEGTDNRTGLPLLDSFALIRNSRVVIANDSGMYHVANAFGKPNVVLFTFTSVVKNRDKHFHKHSRVIAIKELECRKTCHANGKWRKCTNTKCKHVHPDRIVKAVKGLIK
jgi:ADP-heptose:LPS heptosyltransferase